MLLVCNNIIGIDLLLEANDVLDFSEYYYVENESSSELSLNEFAFHSEDVVVLVESINISERSSRGNPSGDLEESLDISECFSLLDYGSSNNGTTFSALSTTFLIQEVYWNSINVVFPLLASNIISFSGTFGSSVLVLPALASNFNAYSYNGLASITLPNLTTSLVAQTFNVSIENELSALTLNGTLYTFNFATSLVLPSLSTSFVVGENGEDLSYTLTANVRLPIFTTNFLVDQSLTTYVVNSNTFGLSEYRGLFGEVISLARLDKDLYVCTSLGLFKHIGTTDNSSNISCYIRTGYLTFGSRSNKRLVSIEIVALAEDIIGMEVEENYVYYPAQLTRRGSISLTHNPPRAFTPPKGIESSKFGIKISNVAGTTFSLQDGILHYIETGRK